MAGITLPPDGSPLTTTNSTRANNRAASPGSASAGAERAGDASPGEEPQVQVSSQARQAADIDARIERSPFVDEAKVTALRTAIRNGEYEVDVERLANAIIEFEGDR